MSLLSTIEKPKDRPIICTLLGDAGLGKTSLAATFPKPLFIRAEDGMQSIPVNERPDALPMLTSVEALWEQLMAVLKDEHDYKTLVIDSVTALERMFIQHVIDSDPKSPKSINQALGGYGAGLAAVGVLHQRVRKACGMINERRGMHVVFIGHADTETIELPDQEPYTRYNLRLGKKSTAPYVDDSDLVGFIKLETFLKGDGERKKAISTGGRVIVCHASAANVSKNRYGIEQELAFEKSVNPFKNFIASLGA